MTTLKQYREQIGLSLTDLARLSQVDYKTVKKADIRRGTIQRGKAIKIIKTINEKLDLNLRVEDIDGLETTN